MINTDRKEAARLFKAEDDIGAERFAESSLRNKRIVAALSSLSPLCNALFQRAEPLVGYTSLVQIPEPARSGIVTIIFAAGRLQLSYLTDTVAFLREQFGPVHIDGIQMSEGELAGLVNGNVREALSPLPPEPMQVKAELASAVKEYFGIAVSPAASRGRVSTSTAATNPAATGTSGGGGGGTSSNHSSMARMMHVSQSQQSQQSQQQQPQRYPPGGVGGGGSGVALSAHSSDLGVPQSPQFSVGSSQQPQRQMQHQPPPPPPRDDYDGSAAYQQDAATQHDEQQQQRVMRRAMTPPDMSHHQQQQQQHQQMTTAAGMVGGGLVMESLDDSDGMLVSRYQDIQAAIAV